jgi:hypothetical protein
MAAIPSFVRYSPGSRPVLIALALGIIPGCAGDEGGEDGAGSGGSDSGGSPAASGGQPSAVDPAAGRAGPDTSGAGGGSSSSPGPCSDDVCPFAKGVSWQCRQRFMYGINLPWARYGSDFGGDASAGRGISTNTTIAQTLQSFASSGVSVVRWWVWPNFTGSGVQFDASGMPSGLGGTALADLEAALSLAEQNNLYLELTLFSFNNFETALARNMAGIARDATQRAALVNNVVRPLARAAAQSGFSKRLIAWDVINEPEWAISGPSLYGGDEPFDPTTATLTTVSHGEMETFLAEVIAGLRAESRALVTVGSAAMKWKSAWLRLDLDYHEFHIYDWVNAWWPYSRSPAEYGFTDKPVVMGEFPPGGLSEGTISYATLLESWYTNGYGGALAWRQTRASTSDPLGLLVPNMANIKAFADAHPCETRY